MLIVRYTMLGLLSLLAMTSVMAGDAGQESPFSVGIGARALGMGGGFVSLADDATALFYNPAGLPLLEYQEISFMHMDLFEGTIYDYGGWAYPDIKLGGLGVAYMRLGTDDIIRREGWIADGAFDYSHSQLLIGYGKKLHSAVSVGMTFKVVNQSIDNMSDYGFGIDLGMLARLSRHISAGLTVRDVVPADLKLKETSEITPISVTGGLSFSGLSLKKGIHLTGAFEVEKIENRDALIHAGAELVFSNSYALRGGYDRDNLSAGAGVKIGRIKIDYAYKVLDYLDDSHRFSLSFLLGTAISKQREKYDRELEAKGEVLIEDERRRQLDFYKEKADSYYNLNRLDSALVYYQRALAFDEGNQEIIALIGEIENSQAVQLEAQQTLRQTRMELNKAAETYFTQAQVFFQKKYYLAALDMLQLIFDIDAYHNEALELKRNIEDAIVQDIAQQFETARQAERERNTVRALEAYTRILELDPKNARAIAARDELARSMDIAQQLNKGIDYYKAGEYARARTIFSTVLITDGQNPVAVEYLKKMESRSEETATNLEDLQKDKEIWQVYLDGLRFMRNREYQKAIEAWERVLQVYPNNVNTLENIEQARLRLESEEPR